MSSSLADIATAFGWGLWLAVPLGLLTVPGTIELVWLTLGAALRPRPIPCVEPRLDGFVHLAVVIPAHDEAGQVERTVRSVLACDSRGVRRTVVVVADNCVDDTARVARAAGAVVFERTDPERRGKGWALDYGFTRVFGELHAVSAVLVVDADTVVGPNLLTGAAGAFAAGADAVQARYVVLNPEVSVRTRLMNVALMAFNVLRPRGRARWALSAGISGNGFGLTRDTVRAVPYRATSVVEDLEYHLRLVRAGRRVHFLDQVTVRADMPVGRDGAATQRARWEGGRLRMLRESGARLLGDVLLRGRRRLLEPLLDLLLLPLGFHAVFLVIALAAPVLAVRVYGGVGLTVLLLHVIVALRVGGAGWPEVRALAAAPAYVVWKLAQASRIVRLARHDAEWVRTRREPTEEKPR